MSIWDYKYHRPFLVEVPESKRRNAPWLPFHPDTCTFCASDLLVFRQAATIDTEKWSFPCTGTSTLRVCQVCGWWTVAFDYTIDLGLDVYVRTHSTSGALRTLDLADISIPVEELRRYLLARYGDRFHVHPRVYEDIVASVFRDFGYQVRATSYSGDEGIDVFALDGPSDVLVGVQVKRWRHTIEAEQIRAFAGALLLNRATRGIYITTSAYQRGASRTASSFTELGIPIELWDAESFYDRLKITSREVYNSVDEPTAPFTPFWQSPGQMPEVMSSGCGRG